MAPMPSAALYSPERALIVSLEFLSSFFKLFRISGNSGKIVKGAANPSVEMPMRKNRTDSIATMKNPHAIRIDPMIRIEFPFSLFIAQFTKNIDQTGTTQGIAKMSPYKYSWISSSSSLWARIAGAKLSKLKNRIANIRHLTMILVTIE